MNRNLGIALLGLSLTPALLAQLATTTSLVGTVSDSSGKVIPNAKVTAVETGTANTYTGVTNAQGYYLLDFVRVGTYNVTAESPGFQKMTNTGIIVDINQTVRTDFTLAVGAVTQSVTVEATAAGDQDRRRHRFGDHQHARSVAELPLNGRDPMQLARTTAGRAARARSLADRHAARRGFHRRRHARDPEQHVAGRHQHHEQPDHHHAHAAHGGSGAGSRGADRHLLGAVRRLHGRAHQHDHQVAAPTSCTARWWSSCATRFWMRAASSPCRRRRTRRRPSRRCGRTSSASSSMARSTFRNSTTARTRPSSWRRTKASAWCSRRRRCRPRCRRRFSPAISPVPACSITGGASRIR